MDGIFEAIGGLFGKLFAGTARFWVRLIFGKPLSEIHRGAKAGAILLSIPLTGLTVLSPFLGAWLFAGLFSAPGPTPLRIGLCALYAAAVAGLIAWAVLRRRKDRAAQGASEAPREQRENNPGS